MPHSSDNLKTCTYLLYKWLKYPTLFASGLAFHPLDGILQALPHVIALFIVPMHFTSHVALLFMEAIWTANIHDCIHANIWPIMGAGYHTIHHTTYRHNYGHYSIWMDWMFGTLQDPRDDESKKVMWGHLLYQLHFLFIIFFFFFQSFELVQWFRVLLPGFVL